jgi:uncharacterized protein YbaR (Trm112 family)/SAM-dependent methyltransferase
MIDPTLLSLLACPVDGSSLFLSDGRLMTSAGRSYPVVEGIPILLPPDASQDTLDCIRASRLALEGSADDPWHLEALGCSDEERKLIQSLASRPDAKVDPVVNCMVAATCGNLYKHLVGRLPDYPIPHFRMQNGGGRVLLDIGCNWGRWCVAAGREGFQPLGLDPQIGALLTANRVAKKLGIKAWFVCADARAMPLRESSIDVGFSYSVLQHLSHEDVRCVLNGLSKALKPGGQSMVQMPTKIGIKGWLHRFRQGFAAPQGFNVRYWSLAELKKVFESEIGDTRFSVDCFFGIGLQRADLGMMPLPFKAAIAASELLRGVSQVLPPVTWLADSVYVHSKKA